MSSIKWILLIISSFAIVANGANSNIRPQNRITEPDRVEQHLRVQDEIYKNLSRLLTYQDSNCVRWGVDSATAAGTKEIKFGVQYTTASTYAAVITEETEVTFGLFCSDHTDTTFVVNNPNGVTVRFSWITAGVKK